MESYLSYNRFPKQLSFYGNLKIQMSNRVLIVDDSQPMRELIKMTLNGVAEVVGECADGTEALNAYTRLQPDWVLMDITMKDVDGITATRQIIAADPKAHVIIVTDYHEEELRKAAFEAGASQYVVKENLLFILEIIKV
jgi:CheY-like chemotaxis protein